MPTPHGRFVWYELLTSDPDAAQRFYGEIAGRGTQRRDGGPTPYTMWINDGVPIGAVLAMPEDIRAMGVPPNWLPFVGVRDGDAAASPAPLRVGEFSWRELMTGDYQAAFDFCGRLFDWEKLSDFDMGPVGYRIYGQRGQQYGGMFTMSPAMPFPPNWLCYIRIDDVRCTADSITRLGSKAMNGPMEVPGGDWVAQCMDPQGAAFAVHQKTS